MVFETLKSRLLILIVASIVALFFGMYAAIIAENPLPTVFPDNTPVTVIAVVVFSFSLLFFGYPSPFIMFLTGIFAGNHIRIFDIDTFAIIVSVVSILASYSAIRMGDALLDDMVGRGNFKQAIKFSFIIIALFLIIALIIDLT